MGFTVTHKKFDCPACGEQNSRCRHDQERGITLCGTLLEPHPLPGMRFVKTQQGSGMEWGLWVEADNCPICGRRDEKCFTDSDKEVVYCSNTLDFAEVPGFDYRGRTQKGDRGKFVFEGYQIPTRPERPKADLNYAGAEHWDSFYRSLDPSIAPEHQRDIMSRLKRAGLNPDEHFPNLNARTVKGGYLIPIVSLDGQWVGAQVRSDSPDAAKYPWWPWRGDAELGCPHSLWPFDPSIANRREILVNGNPELPVALWVPPHAAKPTTLAFVEGTGVKPYIAAHVLGCPAVGASSGNHHGSPEQIRAIVERLGITEIVIAPDAGDPINPHVLHRIKGQIAFAEELGLPVHVLWWGQIEKTGSDIDDGISTRKIQQIQPNQYLAMSESLLSQNLSTPEPVEKKKAKAEWETREEEIEVIRRKIKSVLACKDSASRAIMARDLREQHRIGSKELESLLTEAILRQSSIEAVKGDLAILMQEKRPPAKYAVPGLIAEREGTMIAGTSGVGKSYLAIQIANGLVRGTDVFGLPVPRRYRICFMGTDQSRDSLELGVDLSGLKDVIQSPEYLAEVERTGFPWASYYDRVSISDLPAFEDWISTNRPDFVILDSTNTWIGTAANQYDMNGTAFAAQLASWVEVARRYDCGMIVLHHANKAKLEEGQKKLSKVSGNSKIVAPFMSVLYLDRDSGGKTLVLSHEKHRGGPELNPIFLRYNNEVFWDRKGVFEVLNQDKVVESLSAHRKIVSCYRDLEAGVGLEHEEIFRQVGGATSDQNDILFRAIGDLLRMRVLRMRKSMTSEAKVLVLDPEMLPDYLSEVLRPAAPPAPPSLSITDRNGTPITVGSYVRFEGVEGDGWANFIGKTFTVGALTPDGQVGIVELGNYQCHPGILEVTTAPVPVAPIAPPPAAPVAPAQPTQGDESALPVGATVLWTITEQPPEEIAKEEAERGVQNGSTGVVLGHSRDEDGDLWVSVQFPGATPQEILYTDLTTVAATNHGQEAQDTAAPRRATTAGKGFGA